MLLSYSSTTLGVPCPYADKSRAVMFVPQAATGPPLTLKQYFLCFSGSTAFISDSQSVNETFLGGGRPICS